jgi:hypothetical protein
VGVDQERLLGTEALTRSYVLSDDARQKIRDNSEKERLRGGGVRVRAISGVHV